MLELAGAAGGTGKQRVQKSLEVCPARSVVVLMGLVLSSDHACFQLLYSCLESCFGSQQEQSVVVITSAPSPCSPLAAWVSVCGCSPCITSPFLSPYLLIPHLPAAPPPRCVSCSAFVRKQIKAASPRQRRQVSHSTHSLCQATAVFFYFSSFLPLYLFSLISYLPRAACEDPRERSVSRKSPSSCVFQPSSCRAPCLLQGFPVAAEPR